MLPVQGWLVLVCAALGAAESAPLGEGGLEALAATRAKVQAVAGEGTETVQRSDAGPDERGESHRVVFAAAAGGRYSIVLTDPADPEGQRTWFGSDGARSWERDSFGPDDPQPVTKFRAAGQDLVVRMLAALRLDLGALRRDYAVELKPADGAQRELRLVPTDPALAREVALVSVLIDPAGKPVRVILEEASGNRRTLVITAFADDPAIEPARFVAPRAAGN